MRMRLYHFTSRVHWHFIKTQGIDRGECPITHDAVISYPNLTSDPNPGLQGWTHPDREPTNKRAVRITVEIPDGDDNLISWRSFADKHKMAKAWYRDLDRAGGWGAKNWWVYQGVVAPAMFVNVEFLDGGEISEREQGMLAAMDGAESMAQVPGFRTMTKEEWAEISKAQQRETDMESGPLLPLSSHSL